jgi:hypothetical protein
MADDGHEDRNGSDPAADDEEKEDEEVWEEGQKDVVGRARKPSGMCQWFFVGMI